MACTLCHRHSSLECTAWIQCTLHAAQDLFVQPLLEFHATYAVLDFRVTYLQSSVQMNHC